MTDIIYPLFVIVLVFAIAMFLFIAAWWMFEQTELGQILIERMRKGEEE